MNPINTHKNIKVYDTFLFPFAQCELWNEIKHFFIYTGIFSSIISWKLCYLSHLCITAIKFLTHAKNKISAGLFSSQFARCQGQMALYNLSKGHPSVYHLMLQVATAEHKWRKGHMLKEYIEVDCVLRSLSK
jgi:hypothetical protein